MLTELWIRGQASSPGDLAPILLAVLFVIGVAIVLLALLARRRPEFPFRTRPVLTDAELAFHCVLADCLPPDTLLLAKVRLADFLEVATRGKEFLRHFGRISQKHADFLLIDAATSEPLLVIELDDSSHRRSRRTIDSDAFKDNAYAAAGLPILRVKASRRYDSSEIRREMRRILDDHASHRRSA